MKKKLGKVVGKAQSCCLLYFQQMNIPALARIYMVFLSDANKQTCHTNKATGLAAAVAVGGAVGGAARVIT